MLDVTEFSPLTREAVNELFAARPGFLASLARTCRRRGPRWPFPATVELWVPDEHGVDQHVLATCLNLSRDGIGIRCEEPLSIGTEISVSVHQPEVTLYGRAIVRHRTSISGGWYLGLQFVFEEDEE